MNDPQNGCISKHIFLFPFSWEKKTKESTQAQAPKKEKNTDPLDKISEFHAFLGRKHNWEDKEYKIDLPPNYNEFTYFYDFVRKAIFECGDRGDNDQLIKHYKYKLSKDAKYLIDIKRDKEDEKKEDKPSYELHIEKIYLHVYATGVAILSFHLSNDKYSALTDILRINDFGRRIYPQFLGNEQPYTNAAKGNFLADSIEITGIENSKEDWTCFEDFSCNISTVKPFRLPAYIRKLLGNNIEEQINSGDLHVSPLIDDRMFVMCWYGNNHLTNTLKRKENETHIRVKGKKVKHKTIIGQHYNYLQNSDWYRYIFVDNGTAMCQNSEMLSEINKAHTYPRFADWGTLYGLSRYSFMILTSTGYNMVVTHLQTMYYQMVVLTLMQRASILKFSREVANISKFKDEPGKTKEQIKRIKNLNREYLRFINQMYFREVTAQEQGIELYDMLQGHCRIERDIKDLNREIDELYQFANMLEDEQRNEEMTKLQRWGAILLIPTLLASFLGMNTSSSEYISVLGGTIDKNFLVSIAVIITVTVLTITPFFILPKLFKTKK